MDMLYFEKLGVTYAKGFINQEGLSVYVLPGYEETLSKALQGLVGKYRLEVTDELPGMVP